MWSTTDWSASKTLVALALLREVQRLRMLVEVQRAEIAGLRMEMDDVAAGIDSG